MIKDSVVDKLENAIEKLEIGLAESNKILSNN